MHASVQNTLAINHDCVIKHNHISVAMANKYVVRFSGNAIQVTVTDKASAIDEWVREVRSVHGNGIERTIVGLDCEWKPPNRYEPDNKTATLQLCVDRRCLIVQMFYLDSMPQSLSAFLSSPNFTFVGVEVGDDVLKLRSEYGLSCGRTADIQAMAMQRWPVEYYRKPGLKELARRVAGLYMEKPMHVCRSNWENRVLSEEQVKYACIDAYVSYRIGHKLIKGT